MTEVTDREKDYREKVIEAGKWITEDFLRQVLSEHEKSEKIKIVGKEVSPAVGFGNNYLSTLHRVVVKFCENGTGPKDAHLIVKQMPWAPVAQKMLRELELFSKEIFMYEKVLPEMEKILREHTRDSFVAPSCYKNKMENVLIMEDLKVQGYKILERRDLLPLEYLRLALKSIARLQVLSIVLRKRNPELMDQVQCDFYTEKSREHMEPFVRQMFPELSKLLEKYPEGAKYSKTVESIAPKGFDMMATIVQKARSFNPQVLCHGDMWMTNIMFKEDEKGNPVHAKFVDFQLSRSSSPAIDVLHLLFSSSQSRALSENWADLIRTYHDAFQENVKIFGLKEKFFTLEEFKAELKRLSPYGFFTTCVMLPNVVNETEDIIDFESMSEDCFELPDGCAYLGQVFKNERKRNCVIETLAHMDGLGYVEEVEKLIAEIS